jgi:hypothetical protein
MRLIIKKEEKMKRGTKFIILVSAFLITFVGFSAIASPYINAIKIGREAGLHMISNHSVMNERILQAHSATNKDCDSS